MYIAHSSLQVHLKQAHFFLLPLDISDNLQRQNMISVIDCTPVELLITIFTQACIYGDKTGRSLSLVSRGVRQFCVDTGVDLTTASVCGWAKFKGFLLMLRRRARDSRRVRSLFLFLAGSGKRLGGASEKSSEFELASPLFFV